VFKGTYEYRIDGKGRLPVPAAFRRALGPGEALVVTLLDQCLAAYPTAEWARLEAQLAAMPAFSAPVKALTRRLASRAADCALDVQGRILLPLVLRAAAGLAADVVIVGVLNRFEIWAPGNWTSFLADSERLLDDVSLDLQWPLPAATPSPGSGPAPATPATPPPSRSVHRRNPNGSALFALTGSRHPPRLWVDFCGEKWAYPVPEWA
jgi:MraZ protein